MEEKIPVVEFPLRGEWAILNPPGHHPNAFDFLAMGGRRKRPLSKGLWRWVLYGTAVEDWYGWSQPIFSPADGTIIHASDGWPDRKKAILTKDFLNAFIFRPKLVKEDIRPFAGNYVLIQAGSAVIFIAHMRSGSVRVSTGQRVTSGQLIGEVGNSGNSLAPHLHFQLMDRPDPFSSVIPFAFFRYELWSGNSWNFVENRMPQKGDRIKSIK